MRRTPALRTHDGRRTARQTTRTRIRSRRIIKTVGERRDSFFVLGTKIACRLCRRAQRHPHKLQGNKRVSSAAQLQIRLGNRHRSDREAHPASGGGESTTNGEQLIAL